MKSIGIRPLIIVLFKIVTIALITYATQAEGQDIKEISVNSPISISADEMKSIAWIDETGQLEPKQVLKHIAEFQDGENIPYKSRNGIVWRIFKLKNITESEMRIQIGLNENRARLFEIINSDPLEIENKAASNKNYITQYNLYADGGRKLPSRVTQIVLSAGSQTSILIGAPSLGLEGIEFIDAAAYAEWSRGAMYLQGISIGAVFSLLMLATFSAYKYKNQPAYWYATWLLLQVLSIGTMPFYFDGSRISEFYLNSNNDNFYYSVSEFCNIAYLIFCYHSLEIRVRFPKFSKIVKIIIFLAAISPFWLFFQNEANAASVLFKVALLFSIIFIRIMALTFTYFAFKTDESNRKSDQFIAISLIMFLMGNTGITLIGHFLLESSNITLFYSEVGMAAFINAFNILQAILMGCSTINKSKDIQDQLLTTTVEHNRLIADQNQILETRVEERTKELQTQTDKTEKLMLNILPNSIADRLKQGETDIADKHLNTTILFSDLVGFSKMSSQKSPEELVFLLNDLFKRFDIRATELGLEKIKTIGDAYMVAGGLPTVDDSHAIQVTKMALGMHEDLAKFNKEHGLDFEMRIGINSGPVVAGIIGHSKFSYDLWGNTVNTASRMESTSIPGKVQVSPSTYELIKAHFEVRAHQEVECKGLGLIMTYFVGKST